MPNISRDLKPGRSGDTSDLLAAMKRNTLLAVKASKDAAGNQKSRIKQQGFNTGFLDMNSKNGLDYYNTNPKSGGVIVTATVTATGGLIGSFRVLGYTVGTITPADIQAFKEAFALQVGGGLNPNLITITLSPGSLIVTVSALPAGDVNSLTPADKGFFANSANIMSGIQVSTVASIISAANIPTTSINKTGTLSIDPLSTVVNNSLDLKTLSAKDPSVTQNLYSDFPYGLVGDPINNCMYTLIPGSLKSSIIRINTNGTIDRICDHLENNGCSRIFINKESSHLIIPSNVEDTSSPAGYSIYTKYCNKVYLVNILSGVINTVTLTDLNKNSLHGFDKSTRRFYYSCGLATNYSKLCYVTIPADYSSTTLSPTYFTGIDTEDISIGKIEFVDSKTAYVAGPYWVLKLDLSGNGTKTAAAGQYTTNEGRWISPNGSWFDQIVGGPYRDDVAVGTYAHFSLISDISYDSQNNRLLVIDTFAERIRSVDLSPGNNYAVSTLAGTSPLFLGLATDGPNTSYGVGVLDKLAQVGLWGNTYNLMPSYTKVNATYLTSTFNFYASQPSKIVNFNNNIFVIGSNEVRRLVNDNVYDFITAFNTVSPKPIVSGNGGILGSIKFNGYTLGDLSIDEATLFSSQFALEYGINPELISIDFSGNTLVTDFIAKSSDFSKLTLADKSFFVNSDAIIRGIQPSTFSNIISKLQIPSTSISTTGTVSIDTAFTKINTALDIVFRCTNDSGYNAKKVDGFTNPFVGDPINNCMYTIIKIGGKDTIVRINLNGTINKICDHLENMGCNKIFINSTSTHLIIPGNIRDTTSPDAIDSQPSTNKVYLVNIINKSITTITLTDLNSNTSHGFDQLTRRYYYSSYMKVNYCTICYVTIPADYSNDILSATYFTGILGGSAGKIEFIDSNTAFYSYGSSIAKFNFSVPNGSTTFIAGPTPFNINGVWSSPAVNWGSSLGGVYAPYLDAPIGTDAFFSYIVDISYDSENNRLLLADLGSQRIRSVDLTPGNNYAVTTLAGTSPITLGLAKNAPGSNKYSQQVLDTLAQVGQWGRNNMPTFTKVNGPYLTSTFDYPYNLMSFRGKIYVTEGSRNTRQLSNGFVSDFSAVYDESPVTGIISALATFLGSFKINGYTLGIMTQELISRFKIAFASQYNVDPNLLNISFSSGSLVTSISTEPVSDISTLSPSDRLFIENSGNIITNMTTTEISRVITKAAIPSSAIQQTGRLSMDPSATVVNSGTGIVSTLAASPISRPTRFRFPLVADPINNCLYTLIDSTTQGENHNIVKVDFYGNVKNICQYVEKDQVRYIFINSTSTHLIIPSNVKDTTSPDANDNSPKPNKVYLVNIATGVINTITLTELPTSSLQGFDKSTNRYYYFSTMRGKYLKLCYVTIPSNFSSATLSATYFTGISGGSAGKIEFIDSNTAFMPLLSTIVKLDLRVPNGSTTFVAGPPYVHQTGAWTNPPNAGWFTSEAYGPYLDAPIGTNAFFSDITDISYDFKNNRLLVADQASQRIRSVDLTPGNNYAVTTLAGTSPVTFGLAKNGPYSGVTYSQEVLDSLGQVGDWGRNSMPVFSKINGRYSESTFNGPTYVVEINNRIFVTNYTETRQLYNGDVTDFSGGLDPDLPILLSGGVIGRIPFNGYTVGTVTTDNASAFTSAFCSIYGVSPGVITASFSSGSGVFTINSISISSTKLTLSDKTFYANADAIIKGIQPVDMTKIISLSGLPSSVINATGVVTINTGSIYVNNSLDAISYFKNYKDLTGLNFLYGFAASFVTDTVNDCMYTVQGLYISGQSNTSIVKINKNGTINKVCDYDNYTVNTKLFINSESTHLIIMNAAVNKIDLLNIATGIFTTVTLSDVGTNTIFGFDPLTRRFYYCSANSTLCYVTIPANYNSTTLSATFYSGISLSRGSRIQFLNSTTGYVADNASIRKIDLSTPNGTTTLIAGFDLSLPSGVWNSFDSLNQLFTTNWYQSSVGGPYLDAPIGTNAFFSRIEDICIDIPNNRLLVVDGGAQRIRSVNLALGNNFAVTTLAGDSPTFKNLAANSSTSNFSPSVLSSLAQVGPWGSLSGNMPAFSKTNDIYANSKFNISGLANLAIFNDRIYLSCYNDAEIVRQLSNGYVSEFLTIQNVSISDLTIFYNSQTVPLSTITVDGYNYNSLSPTQLTAFKSALAAKLGGVNPDLLTLVLRSGSLVMEISVDYSKVVFNDLNDNDKSFFVNSDSIFNSVTPTMIASIISDSNTASSITSTGGPITVTTIIENITSTGESQYKLKDDCLNYFNTTNSITQFKNPLVADAINDCMYTVVDSHIVKIYNNGTVRKITALPSNFVDGCKFIFINSASTYLIIPYYDGNTNQNTTNTLIYLIKIDDGAFNIITLNSYDGGTTYGFDKLTNRLYYCSTLFHPTNKKELCYVTISDYTQDTTLSAVFDFPSFNADLNDLTSKGKIEFVDSNTAYFIDKFGINKLDFSSSGGIKTVIAGHTDFVASDYGYWINIYPNASWDSDRILFAPYLDGDGTDAYFSYITDISYDSVNNRLLVCDFGAQRIRSVDLSGTTYTVTTLAGTSPTLDNIAGANDTKYSSVLNSLKQVGSWNNGFNAMPPFTKTNKTYLTSTFKCPMSIVNFNNKIYVRSLDTFPYDDVTAGGELLQNLDIYCTIRQLCNDTVSDFSGIPTNFSPPNISSLQLSVTNLVSEFTDLANSSTFFTDLDTILQTGPSEAVNITSTNLITHYQDLVGSTTKIPSNIFALSGTTIDPSIISTIAISSDFVGILIPSAYPITIGSSTYQSDSGTNKLTIITGSVTETINPGESYTIGGFPFEFLGAGSPSLLVLPIYANSAVLYISKDSGKLTFVQSERGRIYQPSTPYAKVIYSPVVYWQPQSFDNAERFLLRLEGGENPYLFRDYTERSDYDFKSYSYYDKRYNGNVNYSMELSFKDLVLNGTFELKNYENVFVVYDLKNVDIYGRSHATSFYPPPLMLETYSLAFTNAIAFDTYAAGGICTLLGGNMPYILTSSTDLSLDRLISLGVFTRDVSYPNVRVQVTSRTQPLKVYTTTNSILVGYKPTVEQITYDRGVVPYPVPSRTTYGKLTFNTILREIAPTSYSTLYINKRPVRNFYTTGVQTVNLASDFPLENPFIFNAVNTAYYTITERNVTSESSNTVIVDFSIPAITTAITANEFYKKVVIAATSNGVVDLQSVSEFFFDTGTTGNNGGTLSYYYLGPYLPKISSPPTYRVASVRPDGTIVTGKARTIFEIGEPMNNLYGIFRDGDPPGIWTVTHTNIFYVDKIQSTEVNNDLRIVPSVDGYYVIIINKNLNPQSLRLSITRSIPSNASPAGNMTPIPLPANDGSTVYDSIYNPAFRVVMFPLYAYQDYTIRIADPVAYAGYYKRLSEELVVTSRTREWNGREWVTTTNGYYRDMSGYPRSI